MPLPAFSRLRECARCHHGQSKQGHSIQFVYLAVAIIAEVVCATALKKSNGVTKLDASLLTMAGEES